MPRSLPRPHPRLVLTLLGGIWAASGLPASAAPHPRPTAPLSPTKATAARPSPAQDRLPTTTRPLGYELDLTLAPAREAYQGTVTIPLQIDAPTRAVWLQAIDLRIEGAEVRVGRDRRALAVRLLPGSADRVGFTTDGMLGPGRVTLTVRFSGHMDSTRSRGLYRQSEGRQNEGSDWYAYTSFEPSGARRAFPCFDEPGFKAPWRLVLHVPKDNVALGNAPVESEEDEAGGMKVVRFAETPPLPSDLVAFAVGPLEVIPGAVAGHENTPFRLVVPRGHRPEGEAAYALKTTPRLVSLLEDSVGIPYPYRKLDVVVTPRPPGAAGHPGLVVVGPSAVLVKPAEQTLRVRQEYADTAARALAHAWFGGLVTLRSFDETWLDESIERWLAVKVIDRLEPSWHFALGALGVLHRGLMLFDSVATAQPLRQEDSSHDIAMVFSAESRPAKGGAILDMIEAWIGEEKFQRFLHDYLTAHAYGSARVEDFLQKLGELAGAEAAAALSSFIDQPGVPLVSFETRCTAPGEDARQGGNQPAGAPRLLVSQERQLPVGLQGSDTQTWRIPLCVKYGAGTEVRRACLLLGERQAELPIETFVEGRCPDWVMAQENGHGYYRVRYAPAVLQRLGAVSAQLAPPERMVLLNDLEMAMARGELQQGDVLALLRGMLGVDREFQILDSTLGLVRVRPELLPPELVPRLARFFEEAYGPRARALGWQPRPGEAEAEVQDRPQLLRLAALEGEDRELRAEAAKLARRWLGDRRAVADELVPALLTAAARRGDRALQERYLMVAKATADRQVRAEILTAAGAFDDPALVRGALARMLSKDFEIHDVNHVLAGVSGNWRTRELAYEFVKQNFDALAGRMRADDLLLVLELPGRFCDEAHRSDAAAFFMPRAQRIEGGPRALEQSLESLDRCIAYQKQHLPSVIEFFKKR